MSPLSGYGGRKEETMAEAPAIYIGENSPEYVAYRLFEIVRSVERADETTITRQWILDTYSECLQAVRAPDSRRGVQKY
jgi:hypothetical protein